MNDITADKLAAIYIKIRDARQEIRRKYDEEDGKLDAQLEIVKAELLNLCKMTGADSLRTKAGTVTRTVQTQYSISDWGSMYDFIREHDAPQLLAQRLHQGNIKAFLEENPDTMPKGMNMNSQYTITVRRK
jgi:hypothetical protein